MPVNSGWLWQRAVDSALLFPLSETFSRHPDGIAVAVSGGGDSMALLHAAWQVAAQTGQRLIAMTVDHGLRPEAADEADFVARACADLNIPHTTLHWRGADAQGNLMAAARTARYALMAEHAKAQGIAHVLLAHTADDVTETFMMNLGRGAGVDGLASMPAEVYRNGVTWSRPLLECSRDSLRQYLLRHALGWVDDPTNVDPAYLRARIRAAKPALADIGLTEAALATTVRTMDRTRDALDHYTAFESERLLTVDQGDVCLPQSPDCPEEIRRRLWQAILLWIGGGVYPPRQQSLERLQQAVVAGRAHVLHGCRITVRKGTVRVTRESGAVRDLVSGTRDLWDRRWKLDGPHDPALQIRALGPAGLAECTDWRDTGQPRETLLASPAVWLNDRLIAAPLAGFNAEWTAQIVARFRT